MCDRQIGTQEVSCTNSIVLTSVSIQSQSPSVSRRMLFLNRCVHKQVTDTINSIITKLGLDSFYRVSDSRKYLEITSISCAKIS